MTNWKDPARLAEVYLDFIKLGHVLAGLYIWEFVSNLHYEWAFIVGKRKWLWTLGIYVTCRFSALLFTILNLIGMDASDPINCQVWIIWSLVFASLALASGSFLIVVRISAIWERKTPVILLATSIWLINVAFWIHDISRSLSVWNSFGGGCLDLFTSRGQPLSIVTFLTDTILLTIMLVGLWRKGELQKSGLWRLLWTQGLTWLTLAVLVEIPMIVMLYLNLNDPWNLMFQTPALLVLVIGATRMHRALTNWGSVAEYVSTRQAGLRTTPSTSGIGFRTGPSTSPSTTLPVRPIEIAVHMCSDHDSATQTHSDKTFFKSDLESGPNV
ncbi:hypothetical protein B0F90DRAFT_1815412 [Multifurca ochricompacta]|uniref:Uncharacterized protein n=1 Tax=Multifurca ochricompacta TaxID=376703 RepID=A0AAD4QMV6_9AGAM|nr:hypothetical protein B0F90DRAFT_1815412 [Multifurca ochricompacta]